jgi:hypothetical protein
LLLPGIASNAPAEVVWRDELFQRIKIGFKTFVTSSDLRDLCTAILLFLGFLHFGEEICAITLGGHASELVDIRSASG